VVAGEKGGITQHIGAYEVRLSGDRKVTFLDTPGHEAFTAMRARGAKVTDIVVLVVAADDRVMPQTIEAIDHAKAADVPIIVAINKIDKPEANTVRLKQDLASHGVLIEEFGGQIPAAEISAKTGHGVEDLLELILLQADVLELKANPDRRANGVVIESKVEQGRGKVVTVLVQRGTLSVGDPFVCGKEFGKVRAMSNERAMRVRRAGPSEPVEVMGFSGNPSAGDVFQVTESESQAKQVGQQRQLVAREVEHQRIGQVTLSQFHEMLERGEVRDLRLILKADVAGSSEVLREQLGDLGTDEVMCRIIHSGVGNVNESDVLLADASNAVIIGFGVKTEPKAASRAQSSKVDIKHYNIIYEAVEDVKSALSGLLKPEEVESFQGRAEVRMIFRVSRAGTIAGSYVTEGTIGRTHRARLLRDGEVVFEGKIGSLKRFKDDVREVTQGFECGIGLEGHDDVREGDLIETFIIEQVARRI
jgi:translation initiation factor IF-2